MSNGPKKGCLILLLMALIAVTIAVMAVSGVTTAGGIILLCLCIMLLAVTSGTRIEK